jgi:hypothetical protein
VAKEIAVVNFTEIPVTLNGDGSVKSSREDKISAAGCWLSLADKDGVLALISTQTGVAEEELKSWMHTSWWSTALEIAKVRQGEKIDARLTEIIRQSTKEVLERIENGDEKMGPLGVERVKVSAKDLMVIASLALDKRQIIRGQPTSISRSEGELSGLAEKLRQIGARAATQSAVTNEGVVVEFQRKAGG